MSKIFAGNWKMNPASLEEANNLFNVYLSIQGGVDIWVFPPTIYLQSVTEMLKQKPNSRVRIGIQSISDSPKGAFTGQISAEMVKNLGLDLVLVGHSEARKHQANAIIGQKFLLAVQNHLTPVVCLGYQHQDESFDKHSQRVLEQVQEVLDIINENNLIIDTLYFAYEPIWAIGTGKVADKASINEIFELILNTCRNLEISVKLLYGGSVDESNIEDLSQIPNLTGFLVGGASLKPDKFIEMTTKLNN